VDNHVQNCNPPLWDSQDWKAHAEGRARVLTERALAELAELAGDLYRRGVEPIDIFEALHDRSGLLSEAYDLPMIPVADFLRALPGLASWDLERATRNHIATVVAERRRQLDALRQWAEPRLHLPIVQDVIDAAEAVALRHLEITHVLDG
jgi:hypothetical protein